MSLLERHFISRVGPEIGGRLADVVGIEKARRTEGVEIQAFDHPILVKLCQ